MKDIIKNLNRRIKSDQQKFKRLLREKDDVTKALQREVAKLQREVDRKNEREKQQNERDMEAARIADRQREQVIELAAQGRRNAL